MCISDTLAHKSLVLWPRVLFGMEGTLNLLLVPVLVQLTCFISWFGRVNFSISSGEERKSEIILKLSWKIVLIFCPYSHPVAENIWTTQPRSVCLNNSFYCWNRNTCSCFFFLLLNQEAYEEKKQPYHINSQRVSCST